MMLSDKGGNNDWTGIAVEKATVFETPVSYEIPSGEARDAAHGGMTDHSSVSADRKKGKDAHSAVTAPTERGKRDSEDVDAVWRRRSRPAPRSG